MGSCAQQNGSAGGQSSVVAGDVVAVQVRVLQ
jgi:hypothetical protein